MKWPCRRVSLADCHMAALLLHFTKTHWWTPSAAGNVFLTQKDQLGRDKAVLEAQSSLTWAVFLMLIREVGCGSEFGGVGVLGLVHKEWGGSMAFTENRV